MKSLLAFRFLFLVAGLSCLFLLGSAYFLEHWQHLNLCPLCLLQRYVFWGIAIWCLIATLHFPDSLGRRIYALGLGILSGVGIFLAGRQVWLQQLPLDQQPPCTAGLDQLLHYHSLAEALKITVTVSGECGAVDFQLLGLSLAGWSLGIFALFSLFAVWVLFWPGKKIP